MNKIQEIIIFNKDYNFMIKNTKFCSSSFLFEIFLDLKNKYHSNKFRFYRILEKNGYLETPIFYELLVKKFAERK
jgi:hypothetical protein